MPRRRLPDLGLAPLTARSLVLSTLLGSHPPEAPVRALVAFGSLFGIAEGTVRTALSRMAGAGEVEAVDGSYRLGERLRRRQALQDVALGASAEPWDGTWWFAIVDGPARPVAERRAFRAAMEEHRMGELRPDTWLRPANVPAPLVPGGVLLVRGSVEDRPAADVAAQLWDLKALAGTGRRLVGLAERACEWLEDDDPDVLPDTFVVSIAVVRFLRTEPQLPRAVVGDDWPPDRLRAVYGALLAGHTRVMRAFLREAARA